MKQYIYNEIPSWVIDGVNKEVITAYNISNIEEVYVWWAAYRMVTFLNNVITLNDAPPVWATVSIDYYTEVDIPVPNEWEVTFWGLIDEVYQELWQKDTSLTYPKNMVKRKINQALKKIWNETIRTYSSYSFRQTWLITANSYNEAYIEIWSWKAIPSQWYAMIAGSIFPYQYVWDKLIGTRNITYNVWATVYIGYPIPWEVKVLTTVLVGTQELKKTDIRNLSNNSYFIYNDFLFIPLAQNDNVVVRYINRTLLLEEDEDYIDLEYEYSPVISYYVVYKMLLAREDDRAWIYKSEYNEERRKYNAFKLKRFGANNRFRTIDI